MNGSSSVLVPSSVPPLGLMNEDPFLPDDDYWEGQHPDDFDPDTMTIVQVLTQDVLVACIMMGLMTLVGMLGNMMMMRALFKYVNLRRVNFFILLGSVSVADILCLLISVPMHIIHLTHGPVTDVWCKASKYLDSGLNFAVAYHLVALALLRGLTLTYRDFSPTPLQMVISAALLWVAALLSSIPFIPTIQDMRGYCMPTESMEKDMWLLNTFGCFVPILLIIISFTLTHVWVGKRYFEDSYSYKERQMSRLVTVISVVFSLCQLPYRAMDLHIYYKETEAQEIQLQQSVNSAQFDERVLEPLYIARNYLLVLLMADKAVRPIIYSKLAPQLSSAFDEVINCTMCSRAYTGQARMRTTSGGDPADGNSLNETCSTATGSAATTTTTDGSSNGHAVSVHKSSRSSKRNASTSSSTPLTGGSDGESFTEHDHAMQPNVEEVDEGEEELQVIVKSYGSAPQLV